MVPGDDGAGAPLRVIGPFRAFSLVAGSMLGVGIFLLPGLVAREAGNEGWFYLLWLLGGIFALAGASACAEMGALFPRAGGDYVYQREAYGPSVAFASGWVLFVAIFAGSIASMSVALFEYQLQSLTGLNLSDPVWAASPVSWTQLLAVGLIIILTLINDAGARLASSLQVALTLFPMVALLLIAGYGISVEPSTPFVTNEKAARGVSFSGLMAAFILVNFAYSGWINIIYVAGEVKRPERNLPVSMFSATLAVTLVYVLLCMAFVAVLGFAGLAMLGDVDAGTGMARALGNDRLTFWILVVIAVATVTSLNATVLGGARVAYAMAADGCLWRGVARLRRCNGAPRRALWLQAAIACLLVLTGGFQLIVEMTSIAMFITGGLSVAALFVLRQRLPNRHRPYRAFGYPWFPALYISLCLMVVAGKIREVLAASGDYASLYPLLGVVILVCGYLGHRLLAQSR